MAYVSLIALKLYHLILYFFIKTSYQSTTVGVTVVVTLSQLEKPWSNNLPALNI